VDSLEVFLGSLELAALINPCGLVLAFRS